MSTSLATPSAPLPRGFVSVVGYRGAGIVARASGGVIWAHRALPSGPGWHPAPSCLFFPAPDGRLACLFAQRIDQRGPFGQATAELDADEHMRLARRAVAVVELGDRTTADLLQEALEAARLLGNRHRKQGFGVITQLGTLGDVAQPVAALTR